MKKKLLDILACPICKGLLELNIYEEEGEEVTRGHFTCTKCNQEYPIEDGIPNLLPPEMRNDSK